MEEITNSLKKKLEYDSPTLSGNEGFLGDRPFGANTAKVLGEPQ